jgi:preprotein translocase subunit SecD
MWSSEEGGRTQDGLTSRMLYMLEKRVDLRGDRLETAFVSPDPDRPGGMQINFRFDRRGARSFAKLTEANVGNLLAIVLDDVVKSAPNIKSKIPSGEGVIQGSFTDQEARDLAIVLRAGALPVSLKVIEERTIGPTLGSDSLRRGLVAGLVGLGLSILFVMVYYKLSGALAAVALTVNLFMVLAVMAVLRASLSLPGIAGLVLSVAMAVDANVLIFERIREELRKNKTVASSIEAGYKNAFSAILDSNLTTVFAGIVLLYFGSGPVKGFAVTLCIGIAASMFTALFCTRFVYDLITRRRKLNTLSI